MPPLICRRRRRKLELAQTAVFQEVRLWCGRRAWWLGMGGCYDEFFATYNTSMGAHSLCMEYVDENYSSFIAISRKSSVTAFA